MFNGNIVSLEQYEKYVGPETVERIQKSADKLKPYHVLNINSTYYGGGVAELLSSLTILMNTVGIKTGWRVIQGSPDFFSITKKMHNALQSGDINLTERKTNIYEAVIEQNALRNHIEDHDAVIVHDPQPLSMIKHYRKKGPWIWRCHVDLSNPHAELMSYLSPIIHQYDAMIVSCKEYAQKNISIPQLDFMPAIDPFSIKNKELSEDEVNNRLERYDIPTDLPLVVQISRFDRWKDPEGVIKAFKIAQKEIDATLVLLGNVATDDPEGSKVYQSLLDYQNERIIIMSQEDTALVNALQRKATVVLQKSLREGFGLTVAEAMWKGTPVIGGNVGGIRYQIQDGENGFLVDTVEEAADRIVKLVRDQDLCQKISRNGIETVRQNFLLTRYMEQYLELFHCFDYRYELKCGGNVKPINMGK